MRSRREFFIDLGAGVVGAAGLTMTVACTRGGSGGEAAGSGVTIKHLFGETQIPAPPKRVVSAGFTEGDDLLALGVAPLAVTAWFGDQPSGVWPWAQSKLGDAKPVVLNLDNGIQVERIAQLKPDLIIAINAGLDSATYQKLAAIAPTVAQGQGPGNGQAFFEPWKEQAAAVGKAVFKSDDMARLIDGIDEKFSAAAQSNGQFKGREAVLLAGRFSGDTITATAGGWRTDFLTALGFEISKSVRALAGSDGVAEIPRADLASTLSGADVIIWTTESDAEQAALEADRSLAELHAARGKRDVFTSADLAAAIAYASPLSYPVVAEQLPPLLARALA